MPRFRVGRSVPINVYDGDEPILQAHSPERAAEWVRLLNRGHLAEQVAQMSIDPDAPRTFPGETFHGLTSPETPPSSPESAPEAQPVTGQREILDASPQKRCEYSVATHAYCGKKAQAWWAESTAPDARRRMLCWEDGAAHERWGWHMDGMWSE